MAFKIASKPALNKDGYAKVTFKELEEGTRTNKETGVITEYTKLVFNVMDTTRSKPITVNFFLDVLGTAKADAVLSGLGFNYTANQATDDDGFAVDAITPDDEGFDASDSSTDYIAAVTTFLTEVKGNHYLAKVERNNRGYWEINVNTLKPMSK